MSGSLESRYPLEGDGLIPNLYHYLWSKDALGRGPSGVRLPDTVLFRFRTPVAWFFTSRDGSIRRRNRASINAENIEDAFLAKAGASDIVAYFVDTSPSGPNPAELERSRVGGEDEDSALMELSASHSTLESGMGAVRAPQLQYLDAEGLRELLRNPRRPMSGMLQRFVDPKGAHNALIRCVWAPRVFLAERRVNPKRLYDTKEDMYGRAVTFEGAPHCSDVVPVRGEALPRRLQGICEAMAFHVAQVTKLRLRLSRLVLTVKQDAEDRLWILWASSVRVEGPREDLSSADAIAAGLSASAAATAGLAPPPSALGPVELGSEFTVPARERAKLTGGIRPVLAPGLQLDGAELGDPLHAPTLGGEGTDDIESKREQEERLRTALQRHRTLDSLAPSASVSSLSLPGARGARRGRTIGQTKDAASTLVTSSRGVRPAPSPLRAALGASKTDSSSSSSSFPRLPGEAAPASSHARPTVHLLEGQCPSCGAAIGLGKEELRRSKEKGKRKTTSTPDLGFPVTYRVLMQHYDGLLDVLGLEPAGTLPELERQARLVRDLERKREKEARKERFAVSVGMEAIEAMDKDDPDAPVDISAVLSEGNTWPKDPTLVLAAGGGVGLWVVAEELRRSKLRAQFREAKRERERADVQELFMDEQDLDDGEEKKAGKLKKKKAGAGAGGAEVRADDDVEPVPISPIPPTIALVHPRLTAKDYEWYRADPLFLFRSVRLCEPCFLVLAKFASVVSEGKPLAHALRECMGPAVLTRAVERDDPQAAALIGRTTRASLARSPSPSPAPSSPTFRGPGTAKSRVDAAKSLRGVLRDEAAATGEALRRDAQALKKRKAGGRGTGGGGKGRRRTADIGGPMSGRLGTTDSYGGGRRSLASRGSSQDGFSEFLARSGTALAPPSLPDRELISTSEDAIRRPKAREPADTFLSATAALPPGHPLAYLATSARTRPATSAATSHSAPSLPALGSGGGGRGVGGSGMSRGSVGVSLEGTGAEWPQRGTTPYLAGGRGRGRPKARQGTQGTRPLTGTQSSPFAIPLHLPGEKPSRRTRRRGKGGRGRRKSGGVGASGSASGSGSGSASLAEQYAPDAYDERLSTRESSERPVSRSAAKHEAYLAETKEAIGGAAARARREDHFLEMAGRNPVQDDAAAKIQGAVRKSRSGKEREDAVAKHMEEERKRETKRAKMVADRAASQLAAEAAADALESMQDSAADAEERRATEEERKKAAELMAVVDADAADAAASSTKSSTVGVHVSVDLDPEEEGADIVDEGRIDSLDEEEIATGVLWSGWVDWEVPGKLRDSQPPPRCPCAIAVRPCAEAEYVPSQADIQRAEEARQTASIGDDSIEPYQLDPKARGGVVVHVRELRTGRVWREFVGLHELRDLLNREKGDEGDEDGEKGDAEEEKRVKEVVIRERVLLESARQLREWRERGMIPGMERTEDVWGVGVLQGQNWSASPPRWKTTLGHGIFLTPLPNRASDRPADRRSPRGTLLFVEEDVSGGDARVPRRAHPAAGPVAGAASFILRSTSLTPPTPHTNTMTGLSFAQLANLDAIRLCAGAARRFLSILSRAREERGLSEAWRQLAALPTIPLPSVLQIYTDIFLPARNLAASRLLQRLPPDPLGGHVVSAPRYHSVLRMVRRCALGGGSSTNVARELARRAAHPLRHHLGPDDDPDDLDEDGDLDDEDDGDRDGPSSSSSTSTFLPRGTVASRVVLRGGSTMGYVSLRVTESTRPHIVLKRHEALVKDETDVERRAPKEEVMEGDEDASAAIETRVLTWSEAADPAVNPLLQPAALDLAAGYGFPVQPRLCWVRGTPPEEQAKEGVGAEVPGHERRAVYEVPLACSIRAMGDDVTTTAGEAVLIGAALQLPAVRSPEWNAMRERVRRDLLRKRRAKLEERHEELQRVLQAGKGKGLMGLPALPTAQDKALASAIAMTIDATEGINEAARWLLDSFDFQVEDPKEAGYIAPPQPDPVDIDAALSSEADPATKASRATGVRLSILAVRLVASECVGGGADGVSGWKSCAWRIGPQLPTPPTTSRVLFNGAGVVNATSVPGALTPGAFPEPVPTSINFKSIANPSKNPLLEFVQSSERALRAAETLGGTAHSPTKMGEDVDDESGGRGE